MKVSSDEESRIVVLNMVTVAVMLHTVVLAVNQHLERAQQLHLPHCRRRLHCRLHLPCRRHLHCRLRLCCRHRLHCRRRPHQALLPRPLGLQSVQMEPVEVRQVTHVKDQHME